MAPTLAMTFLDPAAAAVAAGLTVPPLLALYFLKLRRAVRQVPSTLLWKRAIEDLQVNSPFQRLRSNLLLLLQLVVLALAALAIGKPTLKAVETFEDTVILVIDRSASMGVLEADGRTRLDQAKDAARRLLDGLGDNARAMVIEFSDQAAVVSSFDTDKRDLQRKIDTIEPTQSRSLLAEAMNLAEAYAQNILIGSEQAGRDLPPESAAPPATVFLFTDGRIEDAPRTTVQRIDPQNIHWVIVGARSDNVGITAMEARRNYEQPHVVEVTATVQNFGPSEMNLDAVLYVNGRSRDVKSVTMAARPTVSATGAEPSAKQRHDVSVLAFDPVMVEEEGVVEVMLRTSDALGADDRAWAVLDPPRRLRVLVVSAGNVFLESVLSTLPIDVTRMSGAEYEAAGASDLAEDNRSVYDVVVLDRHSTERLPQGNYMFWGAVPKIADVSSGRLIDDEMIFNWDETHPVLRHVAVDGLHVFEWLELRLPREAHRLIDGESSPVLAYFSRRASQFLICAFSLITEDESGNALMNTPWVTSVDFVVFVQNAVSFLGSSFGAFARQGISPGETVTLFAPRQTERVRIHRPDGGVDELSAAGGSAVHYARTRHVGPYRMESEGETSSTFVVNLFDPVESHVAPAGQLSIGGAALAGRGGAVDIDLPAWPYFVLALLIVLLLEWIVYNQRVLV